MKRTGLFRRSPARNIAFGALFALINMIALWPPLYIAMSHQHGLVIGVPMSVWYLILVSAAAIAAVTGLWVTECRQGAVD